MAQFWWSALREEFTICYQVKLLSFEAPFSAKRKNFANVNQLFLGPCALLLKESCCQSIQIWDGILLGMFFMSFEFAHPLDVVGVGQIATDLN